MDLAGAAAITQTERTPPSYLGAPFDDGPFQHVDEGIRIVPMDVLHSAGRILDGEHHHLLSGYVSEVLLHEVTTIGGGAARAFGVSCMLNARTSVVPRVRKRDLVASARDEKRREIFGSGCGL
jgi:hypothetical protein